jgi:hypothetical protein
MPTHVHTYAHILCTLREFACERDLRLTSTSARPAHDPGQLAAAWARHGSCSLTDMALLTAPQSHTESGTAERMPRQPWLLSHTGRRCRATLCCLAVGALPGRANATETTPARQAASSGSSLELRALGGGASVAWTQSGGAGVDQRAAVIGLGARGGLSFPGAHLQFGVIASVQHYSPIGQVRVHFGEPDDWPRGNSYTVWSPAGLFFELYPFEGAGPFFGISASVGYIPSIETETRLAGAMYLAGYAVEVGYDTNRSAPHVFGAFLRYGGWSGSESPFFTDFPDELTSGELTIGIRWSFGP